MVRPALWHSLWIWLALVPLCDAAPEASPGERLIVADLNEMVLPSAYRCRVKTKAAKPSATEQLEPYTPNGWVISVRTVISDQEASGLMLETHKSINDTLKIRLGGGTMASQRSGMLRDYHYDESLQMNHLGVYLDWKRLPYDISLVGGLVWHDATTDLTLKPTAGLSYSLNERIYTSAEIGLLSGTMSYPAIAPYLGLAWEKPFGTNSRWRFSTDLGVIFNMQPELTLRSNSTLAGINDDVAVTANSLENEFENQFFVATIGLSYAF